MEHYYRLSKQAFPEFFKLMSAFGQVHAPVRVSDQSFSFRPVNSVEEIAFEALRTILPPKKLFYPQQETLFSYKGSEFVEHKPETKKQVLFGVHPCDLAGLGIMDKIFSADPEDTHYMSRRRSTLVVGLSCMPDKHCFCSSMGTDSPSNGYDIFLTDLDDIYLLEVQSPEGNRFMESSPDLFEPASSADRDKYKQFWIDRSKAFQIGFPPENLRSVVDMEWDNPIWEELAERCLSCGNCTPVCPTCYCFDIVDIAQLNGEQGERKREWDSCQFVGFAKVAGDFNFRPGPVDRLKFWYRHKLHGFDDPYGFKTCVGCGRCTVSCPAEIDDIVGVVLSLQKNSEEANAES